ncbi:MAG: superoxide dismutase family protein [Parachlamydia sp.]|nr:superoxide dismutase family protein [Parachlamydia sp.]
MMKIKAIVLDLYALCSFALCQAALTPDMGVRAARVGREEVVEMRNAVYRFPAKAICILDPTKGNLVTGVVRLEAVDGGVRIVADIDGLTPGKHAFNIREFGDVSAPDGASTGRCFNPYRKKHGGPDHLERQIGDLGNVVADETGHAHYERVDSVVSLTGLDTVIGRSMAVHYLPDDYETQPTGNSGGRIACGVIATY